jgi:hypothetical protein
VVQLLDQAVQHRLAMAQEVEARRQREEDSTSLARMMVRHRDTGDEEVLPKYCTVHSEMLALPTDIVCAPCTPLCS